MTKIKEFIKRVQDENVSVSALLREAKVLVNDLGQTDFLSWINLELGGYKDNDLYPDLRSLRGQIKAWNPYRGWVPVLFKSSEIEKKLSTRNTRQSISEIEELLSDKSASYEMPYPASIANQILEGDLKTKVSLFIDRSSLVGILNAVRNNLLDWAIELEKQGIQGGDTEFTPAEKDRAQQIKSKYSIGNIENFHGNIGERNEYTGEILTPKESFLSKFFWYVLVALAIVVAGNILSALILKYVFGLT